MIYLSSGKPIIFKHKRIGYQYVEFDMFKFRTMKNNSGSKITLSDDERITKIGKILRRMKLDELPQLINVAFGNMVFVGPRPEINEIVNELRENFSYLQNIKPGITALSSIIFKDESNLFNITDISFYKKNILPIKCTLDSINTKQENTLKKICIPVLSVLSIIHHELSLRIISRFILPYNEKETRKKLNNIFKRDIF